MASFDLQLGVRRGMSSMRGIADGREDTDPWPLASGVWGGPSRLLPSCAGKGGSRSRPAHLTWGTEYLLVSNKQPT